MRIWRLKGWGRGPGAVALLGLVLALGLAWRWLSVDLPDPSRLLQRAGRESTKIYDREGRLIQELLDPLAGRRSHVALQELPEHLPAAVIAVEDAGFYSNPGVAPLAMTRALTQAIRYRRVVSGASTITQQLARLVLMSEEERSERSLRRKLREMILAIRITQQFGKDAILEMYLNEVYFGELAYGVEAASRTYFGKPAAQLDLAESALMAGLIQSPARYDPFVDIDAALERQRLVLNRMETEGLIDGLEATQARRERLRFVAADSQRRAPHFTNYVLARLEARFGAERVHGGGLSVVTSLDLSLQQELERIVEAQVRELARPAPGKPDHDASNAALIALSPTTGQILAMIGSADPTDVEIDGAVNVSLALRQPGSSIKPIAYATAFDVERWGLRPSLASPEAVQPRLPFNPATVMLDLPTAFTTREGEPYRPLNYDRMWHGPISLRRALATSSNMVAVKVLEAVGIDAMIETAEALGITSFQDRDRYGLSLVLGGGEVRLLELTAAYAAFANGGHRVSPEPILGLRWAHANSGLGVLGDGAARDWLDEANLADLQAKTFVSEAPTLSPQLAYLITDILADDLARLPAFGEGSVLALDRPAAAKTGTTTNFRDNWTVGYTPDIALGVWLGNADGRPMHYISGITGAGPIWQQSMRAVHRGLPIRDFERPSEIVESEICEASGLRATADCRRSKRERFISGTEPVLEDRSYRRIVIETPSGRAWAEGCRGRRVERVFRVLPPEAMSWARASGLPMPPMEDCFGRELALRIGDEALAQRPAESSGFGRGEPITAGDGLAALEIQSPVQGASYALTPELPVSHQKIRVEARLLRRLPYERIALQLDGKHLADFDGPPYATAWTLQPGSHEVQALAWTQDGEEHRSEPVRFEVLESLPIDDQAMGGR